MNFVVSKFLDRLSARLGRAMLNARALCCASNIRPQVGEISVSYFSKSYPLRPAGEGEYALGGEVKLTYLQRAFAHSPSNPNILYVVSSVIRNDVLRVCRKHKERGARVILNQNGLYYPAWFGDGWEKRNDVFRELHGCADFIIYQSNFCQRACDELLNVHPSRSIVLQNPVDLVQFRPGPSAEDRGRSPVILTLAPPLRQYYRLTSAIGAFALAKQELPDCRLLIAGVDRDSPSWLELSQVLSQSLHQFGVNRDFVEMVPKYSRGQAPEIFRQADLFLHTACNDPCPNVVVEALASGLPVVFSATGGVPELVTGAEGVGVASECTWERFAPPSVEDLASGIITVFSDLKQYSLRARMRAERNFGVEAYLSRHREIFVEHRGESAHA